MANVKTLEAIKAAKTLIEYCKDNTNLCRGCPFYGKNNNEWNDCLFGYGIPEDWEIPESE